MFVFIIISLIVYVTLSQFRIIYYRYFKSLDKEIIKYLESHNYKIKESRTSNKNDLKKSPFKKPPNFKVGLSIIKVNGIPLTLTDYVRKW